MTVSQLLEFLSAAFPAFNASAAGAWAPVFRARLSKHEGQLLAKAYAEVLGTFTVKGSKSLFPVPADFEAHLPSGKLNLPKEVGPKLDLDGRKRRADSLFANWRAGQGTRAARGNRALMRALEDMARPIADALGWGDNPEPLVLTRDQLKVACQRAISFERLTRYGQPPRDCAVWWEQIAAIAAEWGIQITPEWWDKETGETLKNGAVSRVQRVHALVAERTAMPPPPSPAMKLELLRAAIRFHKDMGFADVVAIKERELADLEAQLQGEAA